MLPRNVAAHAVTDHAQPLGECRVQIEGGINAHTNASVLKALKTMPGG
jgi:hypothetical protein